MSFSSAISTYKKASARTGFVHVEDTTASILRDCFKQFGIEVVPLGENAVERLNKEKFDACVVTLDDRAESVLERARSSPSNKRMVVFGICSSVAAAIRYSKYGLNVLLEKPVERQTALRAVRATHLLIINEFRRYVRIPIVMNLNAISGMQRISGSTVEVSGGGMSFLYKGKLSQGEEV